MAAAAWPRNIAVVGYSSAPALQKALAATGAHVVVRVPALHVVAVRPVSAAEALVGRAGVDYVRRAPPRRRASEPALSFATPRGGPLEWQYAAAHVDAVPPSTLRAAQSVTIAVIDTGADLSAPDLAAKGPLTYDVRGGTDVVDENGHGTFVASLAAGSVSNGDGIAGFGGDAKLLVIKAGGADGAFTDIDEAAAIVYAVDHGARVINLSFGGTGTSATERGAIDYAVSRGLLVVAAAGNEYTRGNPVEYPAALLQPTGSKGRGGSGLSVGASTASGARASFSSSGSWLSIAAPGTVVLGAVSELSVASRYPRVPLPGAIAGLYGFASGTSFAAPEVAGAAALVWAANPLLSAQGVASVLKETATGRGSWTPELGFGVIDVGRAVAAASGRPVATTVPAKPGKKRVGG